MKRFAGLVFALACVAAPLWAQDTLADDAAISLETHSVVERWQAAPETVFDAGEIILADLQYIARPIVVFANSPHDPMVSEQMAFLLDRVEQLVERDVILILDTDPSANTAVRQALRPRAFQLVLMDKDGRVHLRKPFPWDVREISRSIDKMPLRQQEMRR